MLNNMMKNNTPKNFILLLWAPWLLLIILLSLWERSETIDNFVKFGKEKNLSFVRFVFKVKSVFFEIFIYFSLIVSCIKKMSNVMSWLDIR